VPFVRFSRDRRGYEHTYLIHAAPRRGAPTRILYWYRTPPGIKVGREAFDVEARRMLETQYPSVPFDWPKLLETAIPPPEQENWRERRRVERSVRQARQAEEPDEAVIAPPEVADPVLIPPVLEAVVELATGEGAGPEAEPAGVDGAANAARKRRRRGGRRRRRQGGPIEATGGDAGSDADPDAAAAAPTPGSQTTPPAPPSRPLVPAIADLSSKPSD
jgi:ribonuclease E